MWCIPPQQNAGFVTRMEALLALYQRPYNPREPVICMDEVSVQLIGETRQGIPMQPGEPQRVRRVIAPDRCDPRVCARDGLGGVGDVERRERLQIGKRQVNAGRAGAAARQQAGGQQARQPQPRRSAATQRRELCGAFHTGLNLAFGQGLGTNCRLKTERPYGKWRFVHWLTKPWGRRRCATALVIPDGGVAPVRNLSARAGPAAGSGPTREVDDQYHEQDRSKNAAADIHTILQFSVSKYCTPGDPARLSATVPSRRRAP